MSPKPRTDDNRQLPLRWRFKHGAYYYRVPLGLEAQWGCKTEFRLGKTRAEADLEWELRNKSPIHENSINELLERYAAQYVPTKMPKTQESYLSAIKQLIPVFGDMLISALKTGHVLQYREKRGKQAPTATNHELGVLSHAYTKAIEWGLTDQNPIKGKVRKISRVPRSRYVEDWELLEALSVASPFVEAYIHLKLLTGLRRGDMLSILNADLMPDGIHIMYRKGQAETGTKVIYEWNDELRLAIELIKVLSRNLDSKWLFCTRSGKGYMNQNGRSNSFDSLWQRFMTKAMKETNLKIRFTEYDLGSKVTSDNPGIRETQLMECSSRGASEHVFFIKPARVKISNWGMK